MVRKRRKLPLPEAAADDDEFVKDLRDLLEDEEHMDAVFLLKDDESTKIQAHKSILTARAEYFKALFRNSSFRESEECVVRVESGFTEPHIRYALEFIYTNRIKDLQSIYTDDLLQLLHLADKWLLRDLKRLVEHELIRKHMNVHNVARMYGATEDFHAQRLARACIEFIMANLRELAGNTAFEEEMKNYPHLCIPVLKAAAEMIPDGQPMHKRARTEPTPSNVGSSNVGSSPVPDHES